MAFRRSPEEDEEFIPLLVCQVSVALGSSDLARQQFLDLQDLTSGEKVRSRSVTRSGYC